MEVTNVEQKELVTQTLMTQERILDWESYIRQQVSEGTVREPNNRANLRNGRSY